MKFVLGGACALLCFASSVRAQALRGPSGHLQAGAAEGYFFVGGSYETVAGKAAGVGQMFVQFHAPRR